MRTHDIVKHGIVYVPEGRQVFAKLTVFENLEMGAFCRTYSKAQLQRHYDEMFELFPVLKERKSQLAGSLSGVNSRCLPFAEVL